MEFTMDSNAALTQLQQTQQSAQNPQDLYAQANQQYGVNAQQDTVTGLRNAINSTTQLLQKVAPSVMGRTASSLVTSAQANKQIQNEQAPISQNLNSQTTQYNQANQDLSADQTKANQQAQLAYQGQQDKLSYLQNLYNTLYTKEQDTAKNVEAQREFNLDYQASLNKASSSGGGSSSGSSSTSPASYQQRSGGGFNFQNAKGQSISARRYAQITGTNFNTLLKQMASSGDAGAADVLKNGGSSKAYAALTWD